MSIQLLEFRPADIMNFLEALQIQVDKCLGVNAKPQ